MGRRSLPKRFSPFFSRPLVLETLCGISNPFELLSLTSGQVTNALLTRSPLSGLRLTVRLACIRHAASVHPEPGSNSPQKYSTSSEVLGSSSCGFERQGFFPSYHSSIIKVQLHSQVPLPHSGLRQNADVFRSSASPFLPRMGPVLAQKLFSCHLSALTAEQDQWFAHFRDIYYKEHFRVCQGSLRSFLARFVISLLWLFRPFLYPEMHLQLVGAFGRL